MDNGNPQKEKNAVIIHTAESFLRFGHFELISAQNEVQTLKNRAGFAIKNYFPEINFNSESDTEWFLSVTQKTTDLMVEWL